MKKGYLALSTLGVAMLLLTGCKDEITSMPPLTIEEVAGNRLEQLTQSEKDNMIYQYVADRITVNKDNLIVIDNKDTEKIKVLLEDINKNLRGADNKVLSKEFANYMLTEFARTPYEWKQSTIDNVGFDPSTRLYFVDVTYTTTSNFKKVVPSSSIANGSPDEEKLKQTRYSDYIYYLTLKTSGDDNASSALTKFTNTWGAFEDINNEQQGVSLLDRTRKESQSTGGLGKLTYTGLIKDSALNTGAKMTFRYVLKYQYNLGEETDLQVESIYLKDYELNGSEAIVTKLSGGNMQGIEVLKPFIDKLINSYNKAVEEGNDIGLYSLYSGYSDIDKYYSDITNYTYNSSGAYTYRIIQRKGTNVVVEVDRVNKVRAKGSNMSLPSYSEKLLFNLVLNNDDSISISSVNLLKAEMVGEPISVIKNVSGVSEIINYSAQSFTKENETKVLETIDNFSKHVLNQDVSSTEFASIVDLGISDSNLRRISDTILAIPDAKRKVTFVVSWGTKTNVFASLTVREVFEGGSSNFDTEAVIDLVNRDGDWKVVNYNRTLNVKTANSNIDAKNSISEHTR